MDPGGEEILEIKPASAERPLKQKDAAGVGPWGEDPVKDGLY